MEWLGALKVAKDIVKGGIAAYNAGEAVDALIARSIDEYGSLLEDEEKDLHKQYKASKDENQKSDLRLAYLNALMKNTSLPEDFRGEIKSAALEYQKAENFALESMESTMMEYAANDEQKSAIKKTVDEFKRK